MTQIQRGHGHWGKLFDQLQDAQVHLSELVRQMETGGEMDEVELGIQLGHVYGHLNRAWNGRHLSGDVEIEEWYSEAQCSFPDDIPIT